MEKVIPHKKYFKYISENRKTVEKLVGREERETKILP